MFYSLQPPQPSWQLLFVMLAWQTAVPAVRAGDWPQILGPLRNGQAVDENPIEPWGESGPRQVWTANLGEGFAGPAVAKGRVIAFHRIGNSERVEAWSAESGEHLWKHDFPASHRGSFNPDSGPRCVPVIFGGRVYVFGAAGNLHCLEIETGRPVWSRDAYGDYAGDEGYFGAASTPIASDGKLLVNVGGRGAGLVAFRLETGKTIWHGTDEGASYSSPTAASINGGNATIFVTQQNTVAVDDSGQVLFRFPFGGRPNTVNAATPLVFGDRLFVSSSYGVGARLTRLSEGNPEVVWQNDSVMSSQFTTCVFHDGFLYGVHGREDYKNGELRCIDAETGVLRWKAPEIGIAHTILVHDRLLLVGVTGQLTLAEATPVAFRPLAKADLSDQTMRALPALSDGRLFVRDASHLRCFAL